MTPIEAAQLIQAALQHHRAGRLSEAEKVYRDILASQPDNPDGLHLLGLLLSQTARRDQGIKLVSRACALRPAEAVLFLSLGNLLRDAHRTDQAIAAFTRAIQLNPRAAEAHNNLGNAYIDLNRHTEAGEAYLTALRLNPKLDRAWSNLALVLRAEGKFGEAVAALRKAIELDPNSAISYDNLGIVLREDGQLDASLAAHLRAIELAPASSAAFSNLSVAWRAKDRMEDSLAACHKAIALDPSNADAICNLGVTLAELGRTDDAIAAYRQALDQRPAFAGAWTNLGMSLGDQALDIEARDACQKAADLEPANPTTHLNLGVALLKLGEFKRGWIEYEHRWQCRGLYQDRPFIQPRWKGEPLNGRTILLHADQGLGDTIQFIRYVPLILQRGGRVILGCDAPLRRLLEDLPGIAHLFSDGEPMPPFHVHCPVVSLPAVFATTMDTIPADVPYLHARPALARSMQEKLPAYDGRLKVGLVWAGRPSHKNDRNRSLSLARLARLAMAGAIFVSLQKGPAADQCAAPPAGMQLIDLSPEVFDLADTAAAIDSLDLVISVDTSIAHLAGAMGKPVWTLLPANSDWRWLIGRDDSPWYPTMRLFRQRTLGAWDEVIERVRIGLNTVSH